MPDRIKYIWRSEGWSGLIKRSVVRLLEATRLPKLHRDYIRPQLPLRRPYGQYDGKRIAGVEQRWLDSVVPWPTDGHKPGYKATNASQVRACVSPGDRIIMIGGGMGVTAITAAEATGVGGEVIIYEGNRHRVQTIRKTLEVNGLADRCLVRHTIVGEAHMVENSGDAEIIPPAELPDCDVVEMDCEGAEYEILPEVLPNPERVIVETHQDWPYAPYSDMTTIKTILTKAGYAVTEHRGRWVNGLLTGEKNAD